MKWEQSLRFWFFKKRKSFQHFGILFVSGVKTFNAISCFKVHLWWKSSFQCYLYVYVVLLMSLKTNH